MRFVQFLFFRHALEVILKITIPVLQEGCFGPRGEMEKHIELIMIILPKNIDVLL